MSVFDSPKYVPQMVEPSNAAVGAIQDFREWRAGAGAYQIALTKDGFHIGAETFADAPFSVDFQGNAVINSITLGAGTTIRAGQTNYNTGTGYWMGLVSGTPKFSIGNGSTKYITWDGSALSIRGTLNADDIVAGTITGRTLQTTTPGVSTGRSVVITGGTNKDINFYYDSTLQSYIGGYVDGDNGEDAYMKIQAASGRYIKLCQSMISINGNLNPSSDNNYTLGSAGQRWSVGWFEDVVVDDITVNNSFSGCGSISGCAYIEVNLLGEKVNDYKEDVKQSIVGVNYTGFEEGDVLVWSNKGLKKADLDACNCVTAVADKNGMPIVLGAEKIKVIGKVATNQFLVSSGVPGYARAWNQTMCGNPPIGTVIAQAMENKSETGEGLIMAMIRKF